MEGKIYNILKKQTGQQAARLPEKVDRKFEGLMKVLVEITYKHKYLEKEEVQGNSKRARTSVECPKDNNFELASRHQLNDAGLRGKGPKPRLSVQRITINL